MKQALRRKVFYSCSRGCFKKPPFVSSKAGKDVSQSSLAGWGRWRPGGIQGTSRDTLCKQQQRFPHTRILPYPASCAGPAVPVSFPTPQGLVIPGEHLQQLHGDPNPAPSATVPGGAEPCAPQPRRPALKLHLHIVNFASRKGVLFSFFFFFFSPSTRHFPGSPLGLGGRRRGRGRSGRRKKNCTANPCWKQSQALHLQATSHLSQPERESSPAPPSASGHGHPSILPTVHLLAPPKPPLRSGCSILRV